MKFKSYIFDPFQVIKQNQMQFFIWFVFTIISGQLGIIANAIIRYYANDQSIANSIYIDSISGSFYTFSIAIAASSLGPLFSNFIADEKPKFRSIKITTIILSILFIMVSGIIYAAVQSKTSTNLKNINLSVDTTQLVVYLLSILIGIYAYCIMTMNSKNFGHLNTPSYNKQSDENVESIIEKHDCLSTDGSGIQI